MERAKDRTRARLVAVGNQKGGVGKTTTVVNLAACLAELGETVLVVDLDPQANATSGLGVPALPGKSLYPALLGQGTIHECIFETVVKNVHIIPSELDLAGSEVDVARTDEYLTCVRRALAPAVQDGRYGVVLIDCPPALGILTMNALAAADSLVVPMQCEYYALEGLNVIHRVIGHIRDSGVHPNLRIEGILMTMFDSRTNLSAAVLADVRAHFPELVYETVIPRNVRLSESPSHGCPIVAYDPRCKGADAYRSFAREFVARILRREKVEASKPAPEPAPPSA